MAKIRWTKKRRTKPLKDITSPPLKEATDVSQPEAESVEDGDVNRNEDEENEKSHESLESPIEDANPVEENQNEEVSPGNESVDEENQNQEASHNESEDEENGNEEASENQSEEEENSEEEAANVDGNGNVVQREEENSEEEAANLDGNGVQGEAENSEEQAANLDGNSRVGEEERSEEVDVGRDGGSSSETESEDSDNEALKPLGMYFQPSEYRKKIKISTRCFIADVMKTFAELVPPITPTEKNWFVNHPQFKHIFHMPQAGNHKVMGMWMLLLRTTRIAKEKEAWFAVNGCPIRYGIREHALISGLNCRNYPLNYKEAGDTKFVRRCFGRGIIRYQDVKAKVLEGMEPSRDRLRLLVLYFLSSVLLGQTKSGNEAPPVDPFLLRAVDDLNLCRTFPWGRLSFDYMMKEIAHTMAHFDGEVKEGVIWSIPGFCLPMEMLAFEAIPVLGSKFREAVDDPDPTCPRMCQTKFKQSEMKGFPLWKINKALGNTQDIDNVLAVREEERSLLERITEPEDNRDKDDAIVDSWMKRVARGYVVRFVDMFAEDVAAREGPPPQTGGNGIEANESAENSVQLKEILEAVKKFREDVGERMDRIENKVGEVDLRLAVSEAYIHEQIALGKRSNQERPDKEVGCNKRSKKK
ncbi:uncharacterized protein At3g43530-like [Raphanus sativus]|uniref:Uncharacterized protein At3g43530-like n=1 Tax=Raphanus sativus TaxID=3726 RepID=A0A9W3DNE4_RAPSA|nr:uncharacterized protein At3g43530-like [Raphanus sativus]XP_056865346.1 uncharacterized protein At3g43530-like [Raphanus sativus]